MIFAYSKRRLFWQGFFASLLLVLGFSYLFLNPDWRRSLIYLALGIIYTLIFVWEWRMKYVTISDGEIRLNSLPPQIIKTEALIGVDSNKERVIFRASDNAIPVKKRWIRKSQRDAFDAAVEGLSRKFGP